MAHSLDKLMSVGCGKEIFMLDKRVLTTHINEKTSQKLHATLTKNAKNEGKET